MKKIIATTLALAIATPSMAMGQREQGILAGMIASQVITQLNRQQTVPTAPVVVQPPQVVVQQPIVLQPPVQTLVCGMNVVCQQQPRTCLQHPVYNYNGMIVGYQLSCH